MLRAHSILGNSQRLDGGAMFGNAPKELWQSWLLPDEQNRLEFSCRALLIDDGQQKTLLEIGIGAFFEPKLAQRYGVVEPEHVLLTSLAQLGLTHSDIDNVVLSHLHFDHAGGLLRPWRSGEPRRLLFDKARFITSRTAFERAATPHPRDRASYIPELPELLNATGRLCLVSEDSDAQSLLGQAFRFTTTQGHTPGMLHTEVQGSTHGLFFCADLVPGVPWVHLPITMGYDRFAEQLIDEKTALFQRFLAKETWLFFTHDHETAAAQLTCDPRGRYAVKNGVPALDWDLDGPA